MGFKGTPAPWIISDSGHSIMDSEQFIFADVRRHAILCRWHEKGFEHWDDEGASKDIGIETKQANAHLIAAAPELLALLMKLDRIGGLGLSTHKEIQSVIAKALGQQ
ncbi:TPA: hypothetical protein ACIIU2_004057 [Providencia stuartii]|uniref:hypothetical protein n=1 Tax=Providencia stuartii TaxID=588 RepID=UPI002543BBF6|nr:hypothetical protein [Providencia thailandensis]WIJ75497.1 hypothetical protein OI982_08530 [Providencia thailandensis]